MAGTHVHDALSITPRGYTHDAFLMGFDLEKVSSTMNDAQFTGLNTKESLLTISLKGCSGADRAVVTMIYSGIVNLREAGAEVLD